MKIALFHEVIREARKRLGVATAKEFHRSRADALGMSYESYANIEAGKYLPPAEKLEGLVQALEIEDVRGFIFSYCHTMMPNELFKSFFDEQSPARNRMLFKTDSFSNYREKFQALLEFNRMQAKYELTPEQVAVMEKDLVAWDVMNLFIAIDDDKGLSVQEIAEKTDSGMESTRRRIGELQAVGLMKELQDGTFIVTQEAFIIPRKIFADKLTHALVRREMDQCYKDGRNRPYTRFRFMAIDPKDRENIEAFIDNFVLDSRRFQQRSGGKTHYLQILFSDRNDL